MKKTICILIVAVLIAMAWSMQPLHQRDHHQHHKRQTNIQTQHHLQPHQHHSILRGSPKSEERTHGHKAIPLIAGGVHKLHKSKSQRNTRQSHSTKETKSSHKHHQKQHHSKKRHTGSSRRH